MFCTAKADAACPELKAMAATPPSSFVILSSNTAQVGFIILV